MSPLITRPFYFIRHGETEWNEKGIIQGHTDIPLNALGLEQAKQSCNLLKEKEIGRIYTSTLHRASQTAQIIAQALNLEVIEMSHLKERNWGEIEGQGYDKLREVLRGYTSLLEVPDRQLPKGAETSDTFVTRVREGIVQVLAEPGPLALIVSHGGVFQVLVRLMALEPIHAENCQPIYIG